MSDVTRFAPSPTGHIHLGSAYSALFAAWHARTSGGRFLLRIEDIDTARCRPEFETAIYEDLAWLGLSWERPVRRQSEHFDDYRAALARLDALGVIYPCFCTRAAIAAEFDAAGAALHGADGPLYPGTCRRIDPGERGERVARGDAHALRLDCARAVALSGPIEFHDRERGRQRARPELLGDAVLWRKDTPASYHLAVTVDDDIQGVTLVTRGADLFEATHLHRLLQSLLALAVPDYCHHRLLTDTTGRRYAKRDRDLTLRALRAGGKSAAEVRASADWAD